jgi:hypothetical protein
VSSLIAHPFAAVNVSFRFQQKFQRIVQTEKGDNFISKLHRGKLDIIPWPVIGSSRFYELFNALKKRLDHQPLTHKHAGAFLSVLKMLMAKLKVIKRGWSDFSLTFFRQMIGEHLIVSKLVRHNFCGLVSTENLAVQRAEYLSSILVVALSLGTTDPINGDPLTVRCFI